MRKILYFILIAFLLTLQSCGLKFLSQEVFEEINGSNNKNVDIYCSGFYMIAGNNHACYWKNNSITMLDDNGTISEAKTIFIYDNDIYCSGFYSPSGRVACYWKNGVRHDLPHEGYSEAFSIYIKSGIVCSSGYDQISGIYKACFWVNDHEYPIFDNYIASSIFADDTFKIYIAGSNGAFGFYWNTEMQLPYDYNSVVVSLFIYNDNVYLANSGGNIYKNNSFLYNYNTTCKSIFVYENDIYTSYGTSNSYYKNNSQFFLGGNAVNNLTVYDNNVYTAGANGSNYACYWKNQNMFTLDIAGTSSSAFDIKVVKKR